MPFCWFQGLTTPPVERLPNLYLLEVGAPVPSTCTGKRQSLLGRSQAHEQRQNYQRALTPPGSPTFSQQVPYRGGKWRGTRKSGGTAGSLLQAGHSFEVPFYLSTSCEFFIPTKNISVCFNIKMFKITYCYVTTSAPPPALSKSSSKIGWSALQCPEDSQTPGSEKCPLRTSCCHPPALCLLLSVRPPPFAQTLPQGRKFCPAENISLQGRVTKPELLAPPHLHASSFPFSAGRG